jgi:hypothetical protein
MKNASLHGKAFPWGCGVIIGFPGRLELPIHYGIRRATVTRGVTVRVKKAYAADPKMGENRNAQEKRVSRHAENPRIRDRMAKESWV